MTDLQIGLLVIGAAAVAGVLVYNRVQERATRREAQRAFGSQHLDVLLDEPAGRREPTLEPAPSRSAHPAPAASDPRIDYVVELRGASAPRSAWAPLERRFARRARFSNTDATLQMVSRSGVVSEAELLEFRSQVESIAAAHGVSVSAPPMREALEAAHALDRACADVDVQIALHVLGPAEAKLENEPFAVTRRADGVTLLLDIPRTPDLAKSYAAMVKAARRLGGRVVDDNGTSLDERALAAIGVEVEALRARLVEIGVDPGSPLALRLFS
jgi:hypothetical protein